MTQSTHKPASSAAYSRSVTAPAGSICPADTSSSAAPKGFREVTLLLAGSICPAGGISSSPHTHTQTPLCNKKNIAMLETYSQLGSQWRIRVLFLQTSCFRRSSPRLSPLLGGDVRAPETLWVSDWINYRRARQVEVSDYTGYSVTREPCAARRS